MPCSGGSELGGGDEGCVSGGGAGEGTDGGASGGGAVGFGEGGEGVPAEMLPGVGGILRATGGGGDCTACDPHSTQSAL